LVSFGPDAAALFSTERFSVALVSFERVAAVLFSAARFAAALFSLVRVAAGLFSTERFSTELPRAATTPLPVNSLGFEVAAMAGCP
jgi:hypothetical protein